MRELTTAELTAVSGAINADTSYASSLGAAGLFLGLGLTVTAPVWGTALLLGASIAASGAAIYYASCY